MFPFLHRFRIRIRNPTQFLFHSIKQEGGSNPIITTTSTTTHLNLNLTLRFIHTLKNLSNSKNPQFFLEEPNSSLTASYLINSCGLSPQSALSASQKFTIKTTETPDSVLNTLKSYGFTDNQIAKLIIGYPRLILSNVDKTIKPKFDFFLSVGYSSTELASLISGNPHLLESSLEKRLKPNFDIFKSMFGSDKEVAKALRHHSSWALHCNLETSFLPNVRTLQSYGVPAPSIAKLATMYLRVMIQATDKFATVVSSVKKFGFNPMSKMFVYGVATMSGMNPSTWDRKVAVYKRFGWSEDEVISAFTKQPFCMLLSEEKIRRAMEFFEKEMHWGPSFVAAFPVLMKLSLENRVIPRCSVIRVLASKGLVTRELGSTAFLMIADEKFVDKYVAKYANQVPEVLKVYGRKMELQGSSTEV